MDRISHEDTPIYAQLIQEYVAQEAYERFFDEIAPSTSTFSEPSTYVE